MCNSPKDVETCVDDTFSRISDQYLNPVTVMTDPETVDEGSIRAARCKNGYMLLHA